MCGIAGVLGACAPDTLHRLAHAVAHRGPDSEGLWSDNAACVGLAHRRLSIIDLSSAATQPMVSSDGRYVTTFNGEIYNYRAVAEILTAKGYVFNTKSDTAVLAPLLDLKGLRMLEDLEGMYAFAIWDRHTRALFIARDHAGIKPLYYSTTGGVLTFASELKAVRPLLGSASIDHVAVREYLAFLWTPGERTLLREVRKLRPGHYLVASFDGEAGLRTRIVRWYRPPQAALIGGRPVYNADRSPQGLLKELDSVVAEQCVSDVPVGAFLSGGVDSSSVVASMVATGHAPARTYCIGFAELSGEGFDDVTYARQVARHLNVPLSVVEIETDELLKGLPGLAELVDEPTADPSPLLVAAIARRARQDNIKVLQSGAGGDDIFSGYRRHLSARLRENVGAWRGPIAAAGRVAGSLGGSAFRRRAEKLSRLLGAPEDDTFLLDAFRTNSVAGAIDLLRPDLRSEGFDNALTTALDESRGQSLLDRMLYMELFGFLPDHNLNYTDKACMAWGIEARVPLIDRRLMRYMSGVSPARKTKGRHLKWFFKRAVESRLPCDVLTRAKVGFGAPMRQLLTNGKGRGLMEDALFATPIVHDLFARDRLESFWQATRRGTLDGVYTALGIAMIGWAWRGLQQTPQPVVDKAAV